MKLSLQTWQQSMPASEQDTPKNLIKNVIWKNTLFRKINFSLLGEMQREKRPFAWPNWLRLILAAAAAWALKLAKLVVKRGGFDSATEETDGATSPPRHVLIENTGPKPHPLSHEGARRGAFHVVQIKTMKI